jgi:tRNA-uridine 2-sulfurtransferase
MLNSLDLECRPQDTRVVVAMSGGVDSSVTAALLKAEGYDVVGVTLQLYDHGAATHRKGTCCAGQDIYDARAVAERIGIPHYVLDYEKRFKEAVIDRFAQSYIAGETPVPCVDCNMSIKFHDLLGTMKEVGAKVLATGHYVASRALPGGGRALYRAREEERDQSYFLFGTTRAQLDSLRFPLGDMTKAETRELARRFGLAVAEKHDSQDICFVPSGRYSDVIERLKPGAAQPGDIVDLDGKVLGRHAGIIHFTIGQRKGLGVATGEPLYVVHLDSEQRRVVVGPRDALRRRRMQLRDVNWIGEGELASTLADDKLDVFVKVRSTRPPAAAWLRAGRNGHEVELIDGEHGVSPGQACVFYDAPAGHARVLGGGFIASAVSAAETARGSKEVAVRA